ncbi:MAG: nuclear transport factor 2 family protein [Solirubrobacterales bacterium]|nr:nuclear transport factor 2 family protein [Solirubrobacterales bacterium]
MSGGDVHPGTNSGRIERGFRLFSEGDTDELIALIHPECRWEEDQTIGWPGMDPVYLGPAGFRRWVEDLRDVWEQIESTVIGVKEFGEVYVVDTMVGARGQQAIATDWHVYNVIWMREGLVIRRRVFINHAEAVETASS